MSNTRIPAPEDCPTPAYHETHRYCPSCTWTEALDWKPRYLVRKAPSFATSNTISRGLSTGRPLTPSESSELTGKWQHRP